MLVDLARHASVIMDTDPESVVGTTGAPSELVSLWQNNAAGLKVIRYVNWEPQRADAVHVVSGVAYA